MSDSTNIPNPEELEPEDFYTGSIDDERYRDQELIPEDPFEGLRPDWKPTGQRPLPTMRCYYVRPDGTRCRNRGIRGSGLNGTKAVCRFHGGSLPSVKKHSESLVQGARLLFTENLEGAAKVALEIMNNEANQSMVRLKAAELVMDRGGLVKGAQELIVTENKIDAAEIIRSRMKAIEDNRAKALARKEEAERKATEDEDIIDEPQLIDEGEIDKP